MLAPVLRSVVRFLREEDGPTAVEYAVILALIIAVCIVSIGVIGSQTNVMYNNMTLKTATVSS